MDLYEFYEILIQQYTIPERRLKKLIMDFLSIIKETETNEHKKEKI